MDQLFWGRCDVLACTYLLVMSKRGATRKLIHRLKYKGDQDIGFYLGDYLGAKLRARPVYQSSHAIVPVPMSKSKLAQRGYNQAELIARGISNAMRIPLQKHWLMRRTQQGTQTRRGRLDRWTHASSDYFCHAIPDHIHRVILVDDVVTTGATIEACVKAMREVRDIEIIVVCLALPIRA
ncbi:MAG: ComF family protein [Flavobacteriales bacterium]